MATEHRRLKVIRLGVGPHQFECQVNSWQIVNNTDDGERFYVFCDDEDPSGDVVDGEFREEADPDYQLQVTFFSDWRSDGVSDYLWEHKQEIVTFQLDHHPDVTGRHVRWTGSLKIKAPTVGGDARAQEMSEVTLPIIGEPVYTRVG